MATNFWRVKKGAAFEKWANLNTVSLPEEADLAYESTTHKFKYYTGSLWKELGAGAGINNYIASYDGSATIGWKMYADAAGSFAVDATGSINACTLTTGTNLVTHSLGTIADGTPVTFCTLGTATGVTTYTTYFVRDTAAGSFKLATTVGGSIVPITATGTGSFVAYSSFTVSTSSPLRAPRSFLLSKIAINAQGEGVSYDLTIDAADVNKTLYVEFDFDSTSTNYVAGDIQPFVIDLSTNLVTPLTALTKAFGKYRASFLTSSGLNYRFGFHVASTNATVYSVKLDNIIVAELNRSFGPLSTNWNTLAASWVGVTNTNGTQGFKFKRNGDTASIVGYFVLGATPTIAAAISVALPSGMTLDTSKLVQSDNTLVGSARAYDASTGGVYFGLVHYYGTGSIFHIEFDGFTSVAGTTTPFTWVATDSLQIELSIPVAEWSTNMDFAESSRVFGSNSDTSTTSGAGSTSISAGGSLVMSENFTSNVYKDVDFGTGILSDDVILAEGTTDTTATYWWIMPEIMPHISSGGNEYGIWWIKHPSSPTSVSVNFGKDGATPSISWATAYAAGYRYRIRKASGINAAALPISTYATKIKLGQTVLASTSALTLNDNQSVICNSASAMTVNLLTAVGNDGLRFEITSIGAGVVTVDANGSETLSGTLTRTISPYQSITIEAYNGNWYLK